MLTSIIRDDLHNSELLVLELNNQLSSTGLANGNRSCIQLAKLNYSHEVTSSIQI